ncbi:hypothetical protein VTL71DRAFT_1337 [Oculimacula yallundae]|uniref:Wax synthase domain-containing protein n=1 Tax=Oculimacula yallundae TaxID=86028 RepID=A0ABR4CAE3_9HELO
MFDMFFPTAADLPLSPPPPWAQFVITAVGLFSVLLPAGPIRLSSGGILFGLFFYLYVWTAAQTFDAYNAAVTNIGIVYRWLDLVLIHTPEKDFWRVPEVKEGAEKDHVIEGRAPEGQWAKLKWFTDLWLSARGVGWNIRNSQMPPSAPSDVVKSRWLLEYIFRLFFMYLGVDVTSTLMMIIGVDAPFFDQPIWWQVSVSWIKVLRSYYAIELMYSVAAIVAVASGLFKPQEWPPITGSFRKYGFTIRKMWGTCWHQLMRRPCSEPARVFKEFFGLKKGSFLSRYSQIWIAFLVSTSTHHAGAVIGMFEDGGYWQMIYFMVQPAGIMLEDFAIYVGKRAGIQDGASSRALGFVWTFIWFSWSMRFMAAYQPFSWTASYIFPSLSEYLLKLLGQTINSKMIV